MYFTVLMFFRSRNPLKNNSIERIEISKNCFTIIKFSTHNAEETTERQNPIQS